MQQQFNQNLSKLIKPGDKVLLAVSGGADSMVMCNLFLKSETKFAVAHCNYQLRGKESEGDELFLEKFSKQYSIEFFSKKFDTKKYADKHKIGIQEAARRLRYQFFNEITKSTEYQWLATAHHENDSAETMIFNLAKGTGLAGLHGIKMNRADIIRPLLNFRKMDILNYARENKIEYREDSSNSSEKYHRNLIRHSVIPELKKINPSLEKTMAENAERFSAVEELYSFFIKKLEFEIVEKTGNLRKIKKEKLKHLPHPETVLYEILKPFKFNGDQCKNIIKNIEGHTGNRFFSKTSQLLIDRDFIFIKPLSEVPSVYALLNENDTQILREGLSISCKISTSVPGNFPNSESVVFLDYSKLQFPLVIENRSPGDIFQPLGMNGHHQKVQDYLSNKKLTLFEKEKILVMKSAGEICWILGHRISDNFKVNPRTETCARFEVHPSKF